MATLAGGERSMSTSEEFVHDGMTYGVEAVFSLDGRYKSLYRGPRGKWAGVSPSDATSRETLDPAIASIRQHHSECREGVLV
jgi:hypothetical protein